MTKEEKQRLEEIKEDIMVCRHYQDSTYDENQKMAFEKLIKLLKRERESIKLRKPFEG